MEITINLETLTPRQAFLIGLQLRDFKHENEPVETEVQTPKKQSHPRAPRNNRTNRFKYNTKATSDVIQLAVYLKQSGYTLQAIADELNEREIAHPWRTQWSEQGVWAVIYSKQAKPLWKDKI